MRASNALRFFELDWIALDDDVAAAAARRARGGRATATTCVTMRRYRPHRLPEDEERMLAERSPAASTAWQNLFEQTVANVRAPYDDGEGARDHTVDELLAYVHHPERRLRLRRAGDAVRARSSRGRRSWRTATTASSPTGWSWTGCATTPSRWPRATSTTSSTRRPSRR